MPKVKIPRQWKFGSVPEEILFSNLSIYAKMTIAAITFHAFDDGPAWPGTDRLARLCSCSKRAILRAIPELEKAGYLKVDRIKGKVNEYQFLTKTSAYQSPVDKLVVPDSHQTGDQQSPAFSKPVTTSHPNETLKINKTITPQGEFTDWFKAEYEVKFKKPYLDSKADYIKATELLRIFKPETLKQLVGVAWNTQDLDKKFSLQKMAMTVRGFCSIVNQLSLPKTSIQAPGSTGQLALQAKWKKEQEEELKRKAQ